MVLWPAPLGSGAGVSRGRSQAVLRAGSQRRSSSTDVVRERTPSVRLVLDERVVLVVAVRRQGSLRVEARRAVLERQTHLVQLRLHLVDGLGAEVADVEQVLLRAGDELTHGVD